MVLKKWTLGGALAAVLLSACGGGGSGDSSIALSYSVARLEATFFQHQQMYVNAEVEPEVSVDVTATGNVQGTVYVQVVDNDQAFAGNPVAIIDQGGGRVTATLRAHSELAPGTYSGTLTVSLCKDPACTGKYSVSGSTLPYTITITAQMSVSVMVDGEQVATATSGSDVITIFYTPHTSIEIQSNVDMDVGTQDQPGSYTFYVDPLSTAQDWQGRIDTTSGLIPGTFVSLAANDGTGTAQKPILLYFSFSSF